MSNYARNKARSITVNKAPTKTDQSAAHETDRNVIVNRFLTHGQMPTGVKPGMYEDFASLPEDLRGYINMAKSLDGYRRSLPKELAEMPTDQLLNLKQEELTRILTPPAPTPEPKKEGEA